MAEKATEVMEALSRRRHGFAIERLLHRLRKFIRAYPMTVDAEMPEHDLVWVEALSGESPGKEILDAIKADPELWFDALPKNVCIVPRTALEQFGASADVIDYLADMGCNFVAEKAARHRASLEQMEKARR